MKTIVISAFPGTGKTSFFEKAKGLNLIVLDSDSSKFDKRYFPENYIEHIQENVGKVNVIFVSSRKEVRKALVKNGIEFTLVYPHWALKNEYIERYRLRGSDKGFMDLIDDNWIDWTKECEDQDNCKHIQLKHGEFLSDIIMLQKNLMIDPKDWFPKTMKSAEEFLRSIAHEMDEKEREAFIFGWQSSIRFQEDK